ncbi:hypothetical protein C5S31_04455 [ANME-1 cluster archaeon GoMg2]|nr:hypothetical protein [ANME-1 cluster archaeon GoMg2]
MATKKYDASLAPDLEFISRDTGLDVETLTEKAIRDFIARYKLEKIRKEMRENVNWEYISKLPGRLQKGLFSLLDAGNLHIAADNAGVPIDVINVHRKKANIFLIVEK